MVTPSFARPARPQGTNPSQEERQKATVWAVNPKRGGFRTSEATMRPLIIVSIIISLAFGAVLFSKGLGWI